MEKKFPKYWSERFCSRVVSRSRSHLRAYLSHPFCWKTSSVIDPLLWCNSQDEKNDISPMNRVSSSNWIYEALTVSSWLLSQALSSWARVAWFKLESSTPSGSTPNIVHLPISIIRTRLQKRQDSILGRPGATIFDNLGVYGGKPPRFSICFCFFPNFGFSFSSHSLSQRQFQSR